VEVDEKTFQVFAIYVFGTGIRVVFFQEAIQLANITQVGFYRITGQGLFELEVVFKFLDGCGPVHGEKIDAF